MERSTTVSMLIDFAIVADNTRLWYEKSDDVVDDTNGKRMDWSISSTICVVGWKAVTMQLKFLRACK